MIFNVVDEIRKTKIRSKVCVAREIKGNKETGAL